MDYWTSLIVYDPINEEIVHLSDISDNVGVDLDFLGPYPLFTTQLLSLILCTFLL
jgi:exonuclease-1